MKIPQTSPDIWSLWDEIKDDKSVVYKVLSILPTSDKGEYFHWDELRRHNPPEGLDHRLWWLGTKLARNKIQEKIALFDKTNIPFSYCEFSILKKHLRRIDQEAGGWLATDNKSAQGLEGKKYLIRSLVEEPFYSSLIEGAATTRAAAKEMILNNQRPKTQDERMTLNNYHGLQLVKEHRHHELTVPFILELHKTITEGTLANPEDAGRLRNRDDINVVDETTNEVLHSPPLAKELTGRLQKLCDFANGSIDDFPYHHPLIRAVILHFMLAYDHPFVDGNGRTARALFYWSALRSNYWLMEYISISSIISEAKIKYGKAFLLTETDKGDLTYFLLHQIEIICKAVERLQIYLEEKKKEASEFEKMLDAVSRTLTINDRQKHILHEIQKGHIKTILIQDVINLFGVSYLTARHDLEIFEKMGVLKKRKSGQTSIYEAKKDLKDIFGIFKV